MRIPRIIAPVAAALILSGCGSSVNRGSGVALPGAVAPNTVRANTLDSPPFLAFAVTCGITFTFGGVRITTGGQVVDTDAKPIPGLFAAGELVGDIFYFNYPGGTGLMSGAVFGRIAGTSAGAAASGGN